MEQLVNGRKYATGAGINQGCMGNNKQIWGSFPLENVCLIEILYYLVAKETCLNFFFLLFVSPLKDFYIPPSL